MPTPLSLNFLEAFHWRVLLEDLPMNKVKFNANTEYEYLHNFKILQSA